MPSLNNTKTKLCYVLPVYDSRADTHFVYLYDLISRAGEAMDIFLVVERSMNHTVSLPNIEKVYIQKFRFFPLRVVENFFALFFARLYGYSAMYIHYSYISAFNAALVTRLAGGTSYYWNCGMPWMFGEDSFLKTILSIVHVFVTGTPRMAKLYAETYGISSKKIIVMPNWISIASFGRSFSAEEKARLKQELAIPQDKKVILFVHRLSERKGTRMLPQIIAALASRNIAAVIVGDGPARDTLESDFAEMDIAEHVRMAGSVPHRSLPLYYAIADLFIMPSLEEGFPHVLLEAMVCGVPFVATDVGGVRDVVPPAFHDYIVPADDPTEFALKAGNLLLRTPEEHRAIQELSQGWVRQYDISIAVKKFVSLFHS